MKNLPDPNQVQAFAGHSRTSQEEPETWGWVLGEGMRRTWQWKKVARACEVEDAPHVPGAWSSAELTPAFLSTLFTFTEERRR